MQYKSLIYQFRVRLLISIIIGLTFRFPVDVVIGLSYKYYVLDDFIAYYLLSCFSAFVLFQIYHLINLGLDLNYSLKSKPKQRFWLQLIIQPLLALIIVLPLRYLFDFLFIKQSLYVVKFEILNAAIVVLTIVAYNLAEFGYYLFNNSRYSLAELERFKKENAEFRFETLMNQVNPHFLFNSLNTLSSLIYENQDIAAKYVRELARVYRYVLENKDVDMVSLKVELDFVKAYIYLLELRFKAMLHFNVSINEDQLNSLIAPLTIQMLIENAVKHNIISSKKNLEINIFNEYNYLLVTNKIQKKTIKDYSTGIGLENIKSRYNYFTSKEVEVKEDAEKFIVRIPLIQKDERK